MTRWISSDCTIIGAQGNLKGTSPFFRCAPVVRNKIGGIGIVHAFWGDGMHVTEIAQEQFEETVKSGDWSRLPEAQVQPYDDVWMLRSSFHFRDMAVTEAVMGLQVTARSPDGEDPVWLIVRMDQDAEALLKEWCDRAADLAIEHCAEGRSNEASDCATLSFSLCSAPERAGLYLAVLEETHQPNQHDQTLKMIETSRGFAFAIAVQGCKQKSLTDIYKYRVEKLADEKKELEERVHSLNERNAVLLNQCRGGNLDPIQDPRHPGLFLMQLGWAYNEGDEFGAEWMDPRRGGSVRYSLPIALGIALKRLMDGER